MVRPTTERRISRKDEESVERKQNSDASCYQGKIMAAPINNTVWEGLLLHEKETLFNVISDIFVKEEVDNPYLVEDVDVSTVKITEDVLMLKIGFPDPEEGSLCYCVYMFFDENFEKVSYFCIEKGNSESEDYPFVCSWIPDEVHHNHGNCSLEDHNDFIRCADIHMNESMVWQEKTIRNRRCFYVSTDYGSFCLGRRRVDISGCR